ncbi:MAG: hypothetical protein U0T83_00290 [Bacteriovoracaceae bacterium]
MNSHKSTNKDKWRNKVQEIINQCQLELKKTTKIGKKMINASKTNTKLHESYEDLGQLLYNALKNKEFEWNDPKVKQLTNEIALLEAELEEIESEVRKIKITSNFTDQRYPKD